VTTIDEFNLRLWTWVETEYHHQPHSSLSGRTPLEVWETDADQIRWVEDHQQLEQNFYGEVERFVRNDSTASCKPDAPSECVRTGPSLSTPVSPCFVSTKTEANRADPVCSIKPGFGGSFYSSEINPSTDF